MEPVVHFRATVSLLGRFPALAGVDLDVQRGSIALVHGPNGAGKTTLLRTCAGLVPVVDGEAVVLRHGLRDSGGGGGAGGGGPARGPAPSACGPPPAGESQRGRGRER